MFSGLSELIYVRLFGRILSSPLDDFSGSVARPILAVVLVLLWRLFGSFEESWF